jgi:toxin ParE1/3/4
MGIKDVKARHNLTRVVYRPLAGSDIFDIWDFIAEDSVLQADSWVDNLDVKLHLLATQPFIGRSRDELFPGLRSHPFGRYVIFYMPLADGVDVVRVIHSTRDLNSIF